VDRVRTAFDRMERFKTRTLLERMRGPRGSDLPPPTLPSAWIGLTRFQRERLGAGELLLEFASGRDTTWLFAVTRDTCCVAGLPPARRLESALGLARDLLGAPPLDRAAEEVAAEIARGAGEIVFGPMRGLLRGARTVLVAPDGSLHRVPFAALVPPGEREPLAATRVVVRLPSATLLALSRPNRPVEGRGMLAIAGASKPSGSPLAGVEREVRELARRFADVRIWSASGSRGEPAPGPFGGYRALHIAGHSIANDQFPWRSGFVIARDAGGGDSLLTAGEVAGRRLQAQLVVLSSCESAGGREHLGEGVAGLSTAFLAAGVPAVIATLWPVDDRITADLMLRLYDRLARGEPAGEALRQAQLEIRARPATRHPYYWAGFTLIGDGNVRLPLQRRPSWWPWF
jgi:hypothetical protein